MHTTRASTRIAAGRVDAYAGRQENFGPQAQTPAGISGGQPMTSQTIAAALATIGAAGMAMLAGIANAAEIRVIGSPGTREPYTQLVPGFEKATGNKVVTVWGGVNEVAKARRRGRDRRCRHAARRPDRRPHQAGQAHPRDAGQCRDVRRRRRHPRRRPEDRHQLRRGHQEGAARRQDDRLLRRTERRSHGRPDQANGASPTSSSPRSSRRARTSRSARWWRAAKPISASSR